MTVISDAPPRDVPKKDEAHAAAWLNLSHELRTPAHAILGHVELLLSGALGPVSGDMRESLGDIQHAAIALSTRLGEIIALAEELPSPSQDSARVDGGGRLGCHGEERGER